MKFRSLTILLSGLYLGGTTISAMECAENSFMHQSRIDALKRNMLKEDMRSLTEENTQLLKANVPGSWDSDIQEAWGVYGKTWQMTRIRAMRTNTFKEDNVLEAWDSVAQMDFFSIICDPLGLEDQGIVGMVSTKWHNAAKKLISDCLSRGPFKDQFVHPDTICIRTYVQFLKIEQAVAAKTCLLLKQYPSKDGIAKFNKIFLLKNSLPCKSELVLTSSKAIEARIEMEQSHYQFIRDESSKALELALKNALAFIPDFIENATDSKLIPLCVGCIEFEMGSSLIDKRLYNKLERDILNSIIEFASLGSKEAVNWLVFYSELFHYEGRQPFSIFGNGKPEKLNELFEQLNYLISGRTDVSDEAREQYKNLSAQLGIRFL